MNLNNTAFFVLAGTATASLWLHSRHRKTATKRTGRRLGQAVVYSVVVCATVAQPCLFDRPLSALELFIIVLGVFAVLDALWKRRVVADTRV